MFLRTSYEPLISHRLFAKAGLPLKNRKRIFFEPSFTGFNGMASSSSWKLTALLADFFKDFNSIPFGAEFFVVGVAKEREEEPRRLSRMLWRLFGED
mmetsp:Transcript_1668/g.4476  ORF Transcript_1668/g.4476 Transcript_1668/m.4476 type:complete len:97 (+) Transcript_1668:1499-1789(+)